MRVLWTVEGEGDRSRQTTADAFWIDNVWHGRAWGCSTMRKADDDSLKGRVGVGVLHTAGCIMHGVDICIGVLVLHCLRRLIPTSVYFEIILSLAISISLQCLFVRRSGRTVQRSYLSLMR